MVQNSEESVNLGVIDGLEPEVSIDSVAGVPVMGTGLMGSAWADGTKINSIADLQNLMGTVSPTATFEVSEFGFKSHESDTSIEEFLGDKGMVLSGDGMAEMGPSGLSFTGYIFIPAGEHTITVASDDGFQMSIGGVPFTSFEGRRGTDETSATATFDGGLYAIDMLYFDGGGGMSLSLIIDGLPVDQSALYATRDEFENPPGDVPLLPADTYHPSLTLGDLVVDDPESLVGTDQADQIDGLGGDDIIDGAGGDDYLLGGYGDDRIEGGETATMCLMAVTAVTS